LADYDIGSARGTIELDASSLGRASAALVGVGAGMVALGAAAVGAFVYVAKQAADFEHTLSAVKAVTNATEEEMESLRKKALELGSSTIYSAGEIASAFEDLGKAGIPVSDILNGAAEATVNFAAAAGDELSGGVSKAAEVVANAMKTFNAGSDEIVHFTDVMVAAAASSTLSVDDIATSLTYVGSVASTAGVSFDELNTMLAILGDRGIKGSTAGTSLRGVLLSLSPTSEKATNALKDLGLITEDGTNKFFDLNGSLKPIPEVMQLLQDATAGLSDEQKISTFNTIFQRRAMASALQLAEAGAAGFEQYAEAMKGLTAADIAATKIDNLEGDMTILKNTIDALIISVGIPLQDMLRGWVQGLTGVVEWLRTLNPELLATVLMVVAVAGAVVAAIGSFLIFAGIMLKFYKISKDLWAALKIIGGILEVIGSGIVSAVGAPVLIVIAIIVALIAIFTILYFKVDAVREFIDGLWDSFQRGIDILKETVSKIVDFLGRLWGAFSEGGIDGQAFVDVLDSIGLNGEQIQSILQTVRDVVIKVGEAFVTAFTWVKDVAIPAVISFGQAIGEMAVEVYGWFQKYVFPIFVAFAELIVAIVNRVIDTWNVLFPAAQTAWNGIWEVISGVIDLISPLIDNWLNFMLGLWDVFKNNVWPIVETIWNYIYLIIETSFNLIKGIVESALMIIRGIINIVTGLISGDWGKVWEGIKAIFGGVWHALVTIVTVSMHLIWTTIQLVWDMIVAVFNLAIDIIILSVTTGWNTMWAIIETVLTAIWAFIQMVWDTIVGIFTGAWNTIVGLVTWAITVAQNIINNGWNAIKEFFSQGINTVVNFMRELPGKIVTALGNLLNLLVGAGRDVFNGLWNGIKEIWERLLSWMRGIPGAIAGFFVGAGTWLFDIGKKIIEGLINGIKSAFGMLGEALGGVGSFIVDHKGPPKEDAKLLIGNGQLIMQSLAKGMMMGMADVEKMLSQVAPSIQSDIGISGALGRGNSGGATVIFDLSGSSFGEGAGEAVKEAIKAPSTLNQITQAIRAGSR
jgi:TP901 family phage tail tape measure protein